MIHSYQFYVTGSPRYKFRVDNHLFGEPKLIIDNDSGTYAPPKAVLSPVKALIETDFPGIAVEALDHEDAGVQQRRKEILALWTWRYGRSCLVDLTFVQYRLNVVWAT